MENNKLDNPIWNSLNETHKELSIEYGNSKFYKPNYCPFGSFIKTDDLAQHIDKYSDLTANFFIAGEKPIFSDRITIHKNLASRQMVLERNIDLDIEEKIIEMTTDKNKSDLFNLVNTFYPGFIKKNTIDLGKYFGIYKDNELVAVTGERLKMNEFTEVSAVVTHSGYTGKGYAKQLITHTSNSIFNENKTPYLHVSEANFKAIKLYEKLGFKLRRKISFWNLKRTTY